MATGDADRAYAPPDWIFRLPYRAWRRETDRSSGRPWRWSSLRQIVDSFAE